MHPIDKVNAQMELAHVRKQFNMCYMKACCELGYEENYVKLKEEGEKREAMLKRISDLQLEYILKLTTPVLKKIHKFSLKKKLTMRNGWKEGVELELMHRMIDEY